jgi:hypothetical protein
LEFGSWTRRRSLGAELWRGMDAEVGIKDQFLSRKPRKRLVSKIYMGLQEKNKLDVDGLHNLYIILIWTSGNIKLQYQNLK